MKRWMSIGAVALMTAAAARADAQQEPGVTAFVDVAVVPMDRERVLEHQTVVIRDGRIVALGPVTSIDVPAEARRIDGRDKYLMPGLSEMHAHIPGGNAPAQLVEDIMRLYIANGVTTIRGMLGAEPQFALRERIESGELIGPRMFLAAPSLNGRSAPDPATGTRLVREHVASGWDLLKIHPGLSLETYDAIVQTAEAEGITWAGHVPADVGVRHAITSGQSTIDHLDGYVEAVTPEPADLDAIDESTFATLAELTVDAGTWNVPTAYLWENFNSEVDPEALARSAEMRYVPRAMVQGWIEQKRNMSAAQAGQGTTAQVGRAIVVARRALLRALDRAGARLLLGTDSPQMFNVPGFSLHHEIATLSQAGLSPFRILESGTRSVADYARTELGHEGDFGVVAVGRAADLILLESNPLEDAARVAERVGVMRAGRWYSAAEIDRWLAEMAARHEG
ncbi:MAG: amidohydrolase family protein [Longimicrobiales bacterium]